MIASLKRHLLVLLAGGCACVSAIALGGPGAQVVDCAGGDSLQNALDNGNRNQPLALLIRGTCAGHFEIRRDDVTLQGDGGAIAGSITINGGQRAVVAGLAITNPAGDGVTVMNGASATIQGNQINDNAGYGLFLRSGAMAVVNDNSMLRNGIVNPTSVDASGIGLHLGSTVRALGNEIRDNANSGIEVFDNSSYRSDGDTIAMRTAAPAGRSAVDTFRSGYVDLRGATIDGRVFVNQQSHLQVRNLPGGPSIITGDIAVSGLSFLRLRAGVARAASNLGCGAQFSVCVCDGFASCPVSVP